MTEAPSRPWRMVLPLAGILALAALWSVYWLTAFGRARTEVAEQRKTWAARGVTLACKAETWGGYPFRFEFACSDPELTIAGAAPIRVRWNHVRVAAQAYNPFHLVALADGPGEVENGRATLLSTGNGRSLASYKISTASGHAIGLDMPPIEFPGVIKAERFLLNATIREGDTSDIRLALEQAVIALPGGAEERADRIALDVDFPNRWLAGDIAAGAATVKGAEITRGALRMTGRGTIGLDATRRFDGRIATETNDIDTLLDIVSPHAGMNEKDRAAVKTLLGLIGSAGQGKAARADLIAKAGEVYWGPVRVAVLPPLY